MNFDPLLEEDDDLLGMGTADTTDAEPVDTIAGPQSNSARVKQKIMRDRNPAESQPEVPAAPAQMAPSQFELDPEVRKSAADSQLYAGLGRAVNAIASGTGYKADNSGYDAMDKDAEKSLDRAALVKKMIAQSQVKGIDQGIKKSALDERALNDQAKRDAEAKRIAAYENRTNKIAGNAQSRMDTSNIRAANAILNNPNIGKETTKLNAARSAQSLVDSIRSGELTDSKNIAKQLTNMIATIEMGTPGGQGDRQAMGVDTLYTRLKGMESYLSGNPTSSIPKDYLNQLESEVHALGDRAASNYKNLSESLLKGTDLSGGDPSVDPGKVHALAKQRRDEFLKSAGYDPETGMPIKQRASSMKKPSLQELAKQELERRKAARAGGGQ